MSKVICIAGESGTGKTTAMRNLNPRETYYIDCDRKGLSWKDWRKQYNSANKNYMATNKVDKIETLIKGIAENCPDIHYIVIDTLNGIMVGDEMRRINEKGYDKWVDLAQCIWNLLDHAYDYRDDLTIIFTAHTQTDRDDSGFHFTHIKTSGQKLQKIVPESKLTTVLMAECIDGEYVLKTKSDHSTCKTPMGAFASDTVPNDIVEVLKALKEY